MIRPAPAPRFEFRDVDAPARDQAKSRMTTCERRYRIRRYTVELNSASAHRDTSDTTRHVFGFLPSRNENASFRMTLCATRRSHSYRAKFIPQLSFNRQSIVSQNPAMTLVLF
jgi:hypothetical protein